MKYMTKEYIKECDYKEIQDMRNNFWVYGDYISINKNSPNIVLTECEGKSLLADNQLWIPTSQQLDDEIVKICNANKHGYSIDHTWRENLWAVVLYDTSGLVLSDYYITNSNPLIAKIRLLKELLNNKGKE